ncbi:MAG: hypothetical protein ACI8P9_001345, partial [Parasphingorhabdus sp.]
KFKVAFVQPIIAWCWSIAATTDLFAVTARNYFNFYMVVTVATHKAYLIVDKRLEFVTLI